MAAEVVAPAIPRQTSRSRGGGVLYSGSQLVSAGVSTLAGLVTRALVPPAAFGGLATAQAPYAFVNAYNSAIRNAIERSLPAHRARGEHAAAEAARDAAYGVLLASVVVESVVLAALGFLSGHAYVAYAFWTLAALNVFDSLAVADAITIKSELRFVRVAAGHLASAILRAGILLGLAYMMGVEGYFLGLALGGAASFVVFRAISGLSWLPAFRLTAEALRSVLALGLPMAALNFARQAVAVVDRFAIVGVLGVEALGFYSLGLTIVAAVLIVPATLGGASFPRLVGDHATGRLREARIEAGRSRQEVALVAALGASAAVAALPWLVSRLLPEYMSAIRPIQILLVASYFTAAGTVGYQILVTTASLRGPIIWALVVAAATGIAAYLAAAAWGLPGIAAVMVASSLLHTAGVEALASRRLGSRGMGAVAALSLLPLGTLVAISAFPHDGLAAAILAATCLAGGAFVLRRLRHR